MQKEVPISELQKHKIFVATPMYGGVCYGSYTKSLIDLSRVCQNYGIQTQFSFIFNESLITRARNYMVDEFLRSDFTHMMFIDSDIDFNPMDVLSLLALQKPIVGGLYPKKCVAWENVNDAARYGMVPRHDPGKLAEFAGDFVFNAVPGTREIKLNEPVEVLEIGTGFMMIDRSVFTKFVEAYPQYEYVPDHNRSAAFDGSRKIHQFFQAEIDEASQRYLSEDYWFCQKARAMGESVWIAPWMNLKHHGTYIYGGSIGAMAAVINERIKRNDQPPPVAPVNPASKPTNPTGVMTVDQFRHLSATKRNDLIRTWAVAVNIDPLALRDYYQQHRDEWLNTSPTESIATLMGTYSQQPSSSDTKDS
jgi:hypothetical protein